MSTIKEGASVPDVTFHMRKGGQWVHVTTKELFEGRHVVLFALPGAFTPTCSSTHLPGYMALSSQIKERGIDTILCMSVNDTFVMNAWAKDQGVQDEVAMLPDGSGAFSKGLGILVDKSDIGFGMRAWRCSMVIRNGVVGKVFEEDRTAEGDPFEVSDAQHMLDYLSR